MQKFDVVEIRGMRVLTTKQIAEAYGADVKTVQYNFRYNKEKYLEGKHYIEVKDGELRELKTRNEFQSSLKYAKRIYLWTEKGALLHAKSLNTDKAWEVYDYLVDFYFRAKETVPATKEEKSSGRLVVDVPENPEIQKRLSIVRKYINAVDTILDEYNTYHCEENYKHYCMVLNNLSVALIGKVLNLLETKPNMVKKHY